MALEPLDVSVVLVFAEPLSALPNLAPLLESDDFGELMRSPVTLTGGLTVDIARNVTAAQVAESMRSQKTVALSAARLEAHDRSGAVDFVNGKLVRLACGLARAVAGVSLSAVGANFEFEFRPADRQPAARRIAVAAFGGEPPFVPPGLSLAGGAVRLFLSADSDVTYNLAIEPRNQDPSTHVGFMHLNASSTAIQTPDENQIAALLEQGLATVEAIAQSFFPQPTEVPV